MEIEGIRIRKMKPEDAVGVYDLASKEERFQVSGHTQFWGIHQLEAWSKSKLGVCLIAEYNGMIVGFALSQLHKPTGKATLENLFVKPEYRRRGIGKELFILRHDMLNGIGATYQCAMIEPDNKVIISIMKEAGFSGGKIFIWVDKNQE